MNLFSRTLFVVSAVALMSLGCAETRPAPVAFAPDLSAAAKKAHSAYLAAINTNKIDAITMRLTEDVVFLPPNEPALVGKPAIHQWGADFLSSCAFHEEQTVIESVATHSWMMLRYSYKQIITPRATGSTPMVDTGKGVLIFHHEPDGQWRVARDVWNSDQPAVK